MLRSRSLGADPGQVSNGAAAVSRASADVGEYSTMHASRLPALPVLARGLLIVAAIAARPAFARDVPEPLQGSGVAFAPRDAAFFSASLRLREQWDRIASSNAYAHVMRLPAVRRLVESVDEQRTMPGSPLSMAETFLSMPDNQEAIALLADMVATDTFVYGEPSCVSFLELVQKLQQAQQAGAFGDRELDDLPSERQARAVATALVDNLDLLVVPELVWGFKTGRAATARGQLGRLEALATLLGQFNPVLDDAIERREVAGGDFLVARFSGGDVPWRELEDQLVGDLDGIEGLDRVFDRLESLELVVAIGTLGDRVIFTVGGSLDHLVKVALPEAVRPGLVTTEPFAPLLAQAGRPLTGISYVSQEMAAALATTASDLQPVVEGFARVAASADLPDGAAADIREWLDESAAAIAKRLPVPGPRMAFSSMSPEGYAGEAWDWSRNQPLDGSRRLDLLDHAGGEPLAAMVTRLRSDPLLLPDAESLARAGLALYRRYGLPGLDDDDAAEAAKFEAALLPLAERLGATLRDKIVPALGDGQIGLVLDATSKSKRPHRDLPASAEPLPLIEPAIVLPLADEKRFRSGLSDVFELADELVESLRRLDAEGIPRDYRVPAPAKERVESGTVWTFAVPAGGLDAAVAPAIGIGAKAAVFSLVPRQAGRLLAAARLQTSPGESFGEPLASAGVIDVAATLETLRPWIAYGARYAAVAGREGFVDPETELSVADETPQTRELLETVSGIVDACQCLRSAVKETTVRDDAVVTAWRAVVRDMPAAGR
jgi:hypothetical protein